MGRILDIEKVAKKITLVETEIFLDNLCKKKSYKLSSSYPPINNINCRLEKGDMCFILSAEKLSRKELIVKY